MSSELDSVGPSIGAPGARASHRRAGTGRVGHPYAGSDSDWSGFYGPAANRRPLPARWESRYATAVVATDLTLILLAVGVGALLTVRANPEHGGIAAVVAGSTALGLILSMIATRGWEPRILGQDSGELGRLILSVVGIAVVLGMTGFALDVDAIRPWAFGVIPAVGVLIMLSRFGLRRALHRQRGRGRCLHRVLALGTEASISDLAARTRRDPRHGWVVAGACTASGTAPDCDGEGEEGNGDIAGVPVVGDLDAVAKTVRAGRYRVVAVAPSEGWTPRRLNQLAWELQGTGAELVVHPGLMEVAGPRLHVAPVEGLPLLRLSEPTLIGVPRVVKGFVDRLAAAVLILLLLPLLLVVYLTLRLTGGPGFVRQTRVGRNGRPFRMVTFRSAGRNAAHAGRFGRWLRRYAVDELPRLFNVLSGSMSLVGPRPPRPEEVVTDTIDAPRRLRVKPGLTGLWLLSGRVDLTWEESVQLEARYVENWSLALDALILCKTIGAVLRRDGAH
ncbi:MAG: sugar transferase [Pseudonocardia sp.]